MARKQGAKDRKHEERRQAMLSRIRDRLGQPGATHASWRELAAAADVGLATLAHYFGKREDVILALMEDYLAQGEEPLRILATAQEPFAVSIASALEHLAVGLRYGVSEALAVGLAEGLRQPRLGPAFIKTGLEPIVQALASRLSTHIERGEMREVNPRIASLQLSAPLVLAWLHQHELGGEADYPLEMKEVIAMLTNSFVAAYAVSCSPRHHELGADES
jgi:AcrR family transcriptional regulator